MSCPGIGNKRRRKASCRMSCQGTGRYQRFKLCSRSNTASTGWDFMTRRVCQILCVDDPEQDASGTLKVHRLVPEHHHWHESCCLTESPSVVTMSPEMFNYRVINDIYTYAFIGTPRYQCVLIRVVVVFGCLRCLLYLHGQYRWLRLEDY